MTIILNENKYALEILDQHIVGQKPSETLSILARYYRHKENKKDKEIYEMLNKHMADYCPNYNPVKWSSTLKSQVQKSKKYALTEIDKIPVTQNELNTIHNLNSIRLERLAFVLLVSAKFSNLRNTNNNNWVNRECKELFKMARISTSIANQCKMIYNLKELGLISLSKKVDNTNMCINYIDITSPVQIDITDMRELGYEYMLYCNAPLTRCEKCGVLIHSKGTKRKYCEDCSKYQPRLYKMIQCTDCKKDVIVDSKDNSTSRCNECYQIYRRNCIRENVKNHRNKNNVIRTILNNPRE